ncbi:MAG TPA: protein kinase, partial [Thermoanaerobaculia bacterium]|nr:protein kinase [Thermoanaerobaculia bacterium]
MKSLRLRFGLLPRIALALAAVGLLPVAISMLGLLDVNRDALYEQVLRTHSLAAQTGATRTGAFLATRLSLARGAAANPALADPRSEEARDFLFASLSAWADLGVSAVSVVNEQGEEVIRAQLKGGDAQTRDKALGLPSGKTVAVVPGDPPGDPPVIRLEAPLAQAAGRLRLVCDGAPLADVAHPVELGEQAEIVVADRDGTVVLGPATALSGLPQTLVENALSGRISGGGRFQDGRGGEILAAWAPVPESDWAILSRQPARIAEAVAGELRRRAAWAVGAALALIGVLSALAYGTVIRPIRELIAAQRDLAKAAPDSTGDEISDLRRTFDALRRSLSDRSALSNVFLGRYQVLEPLGTGGMGTVFRGWDPKLQRPVALKTVRLGGNLEPERRREMIATLLREAVTVARFSHPNVVTVYDLEDAPEGAFVAMELVEGLSLERFLWNHDRLDPDRVIVLGAAMAKGLAAAHEREIVHRDVKPANVLLGRDGSIKVADFGISDLVAASANEKDTFFGTPGYVPPESLQGKGFGPSGDLFALGVILYECLTGTRPFGGLDVSDAVHATLFGTVQPPSRKAPGIPPELDALILRLLEKDPARRP